MSTIPTACQSIYNQIQALKNEKSSLQMYLKDTAGAEKWALLQEIAAIDKQINELEKKYNSCLVANDIPVPLRASLAGTYILRTSYSKAPGPIKGTMNLGLYFDANRTTITITKFPPIITEPFDTPLGANYTTVTMNSGGIGPFTAATGAVLMPIKLFFDQSIDIPIYTEDSYLTLQLTTGTANSQLGNLIGSPLNAAGAITIVGAGTFSEGFLGGYAATLSISGTITPHPTKK